MVLQSKGRVRDQDRISELPDGVLSHILGFLGPQFVKCAVRTSILSKRWKNMWECAPNVALNSKDFRSIADFRAWLFNHSKAVSSFQLLHCRRYLSC